MTTKDQVTKEGESFFTHSYFSLFLPTSKWWCLFNRIKLEGKGLSGGDNSFLSISSIPACQIDRVTYILYSE